MTDRDPNDMTFSAQAQQHLEWLEERAFDEESDYFGSEPDDLARMAYRSNAYAKANVYQTRWAAVSLAKIERQLIGIRKAVRILAAASVMICILLVGEFSGWF